MAKYTPANNKKWKIVPITLGVMCLILVIIVIGEASGTTNLFGQNPSPTNQSNNGNVSLIDYSAATDEEKINAPQKDQDNQNEILINPDENITVTLSAAGQDEVGGPLIVRSILQNADGGGCTLVLDSGEVSRTYNSEVVFAGTYYACNFTVPATELLPGEWNLSLTAKQNDTIGSVAKTIIISTR